MKQPTTIADVITDPVFRENVMLQIAKIQTSHDIRPQAKPGFHYVRNEIDRMIEADHLEHQYFCDHIELIWRKQSLLNSNERHVINAVCSISLRATAEHYKQVTQSTT